MDTKNVIKTFIINNFLKGDKSIILRDESSFLEEGVIDSVGILELVAYIEEKYGFHVEDDELVPENLDSIEKLEAYINTKVVTVKA
jgi:acyl carrier protein